MLISGNNERLNSFNTNMLGLDSMSFSAMAMAIYLGCSGNLLPGIGVVILYMLLRSMWIEKMPLVRSDKWRQVLRTKLTWNDRLLLFLAGLSIIVVLQLLFTGHVIAADPVSPDAGKGAATGLNKAWETLFKADGSPSFFGTLCNTLKGLGIIALVIQGLKVFIKLVSSEGDSSVKEFTRTQLIERIIPNAVVILLLTNNGAGGSSLILNARSFIFAWDKVAYTAMKDVADNLNQQAIIGEERKALEKVRAVYSTCISMPIKIGGEDNPLFIQCLGEFKTEVIAAQVGGKVRNQAVTDQLVKLNNELARISGLGAGGSVGADFGRTLINIGTLVSSALGSTIKDGTDAFVNTFVESIGIAYNFCIELALMLMGVSLPLVLMLSLYKIDVFLRWLPQLLNLFVAKISYTIVGGLIQYLKADAGSDLGVWGLSILIGLGAPFVSIFVSMALSGSMGAVFEREAVKAGAGAARMAAGGVAAAGGMVGNMLAGPAGGVAVGAALDVIAKRV
jgi:hypothetical protein